MSEQVDRLYGKAEALGVGIGEACDRAGLARSTPSRWRAGTTPRPHLVARLDAAISAIARERGTDCPSDAQPPPGDPTAVARDEIETIQRALGRLAAALDVGIP